MESIADIGECPICNGTLKHWKYSYFRCEDCGYYYKYSKIKPNKLIHKLFFYDIFSNKKAGTKIKKEDIQNKFKQNFNIDLGEGDLSAFIKEFNEKLGEYGKQIKNTTKGDYEIFPSKEEQMKLVSKLFMQENNGMNLKIEFLKNIYYSFKKEYHYNVEKKIDEIIRSFLKKTEDFINLYIDRKLQGSSDLSFLSYENVNEAFEKEEHLAMSKKQFIELMEEKKEEESTQYKILEISDDAFLLTKSNIAKIPQRVVYKDGEIGSEYLNGVNAYLNKCGYELRKSIYNPQEYIFAYCDIERYNKCIISQKEEDLRKVFLEKMVGHSFFIDEMVGEMEKKYEIEYGNECLAKAVDEANKKLLDIKLIITRNGQIKSVLRNEDYSFGSVGCPFCKEKNFNNDDEIKDHILKYHATSDDDCSILTWQTDLDYYCHHCQQGRLRLRLEKISLKVVLRHIKGECIKRK